MGNNRSHLVTDEHLSDLLRAHPGGLTVAQIAEHLNTRISNVQRAVRRGYHSNLLLRAYDYGNLPSSRPAQYAPYRYAYNLDRRVFIDREARISPQARGAVRVLRHLSCPSAPLIAASYGCTYPVAHGLLAELTRAGLVGA